MQWLTNSAIARLVMALSLLLCSFLPAQAQDPGERALNLQLGSLFQGVPRLMKWDGDIRYAIVGIQGKELELFNRYMGVLGNAAGLKVSNAKGENLQQANAFVIFTGNYASKATDKFVQKAFKEPGETDAQMAARFATYDQQQHPGVCRIKDDQGRIQLIICMEAPKYHHQQATPEDIVWRAVSGLFSIRRADFIAPSVFNSRPVGLHADRLSKVDEALIRSIYDYSIPAGQAPDLAMKRIASLVKGRLQDQ